MSVLVYKKSFDSYLDTYAERKLAKLGKKLGDDRKHSPFLQYINSMRQGVLAIPRIIKEASSIQVPDGYEAGYQGLKLALMRGDDITSYLGEKTGSRQYGDHTDFAHALYGFHHFHLGVKDRSNRVPRTRYIALAYVTNSTVYLVSIVPHKDDQGKVPWFDKEFLEIVHQEWPEVIKCYRLPKGSKPMRDIDSEDIEALTKARVNTYFQMNDGTMYAMLGGGVTGSGMHGSSVSEYNQVFNAFAQMHSEIEKYAERVRSKFTEFTLFHIGYDTLIYKQLGVEVYFAVYFKGDKCITAYASAAGCPKIYAINSSFKFNRIADLLLSQIRIQYDWPLNFELVIKAKRKNEESSTNESAQ